MKPLRRFILLHRRWFAAGLIAIAVFSGLTALRAAPPGAEVPVAAHDLPAGHTIKADDVRQVRVSQAPAGNSLVRSELTNRVIAAPMREGEMITDQRVLGPDLLAGYDDGMVLVRVAVDEPSARTVQVGDTVSVLGGDDSSEFLVKNVKVAMSDESDDAELGSYRESLVGVVVPRDDAPKLAQNAKQGLTLVVENGQDR